ncbi:MAG: HAD family hydrolase [Kofleriaceae bacterium]
MPDRPALRAIVFDFDGVILESAEVKTRAFVELFSSHGTDVQRRVREHHLANLGISRFKKFAWIYEHILAMPLSDEDSKALGDRFTALALENVLAAPFVPGAHEALVALAPHHALFVASGTPQAELDLIVERRSLHGLFREVHGTPRDKPTILTDLMDRHGLTPEHVLFIGDGLSDYQAAITTSIAFLARDTPELHEQWLGLGVQRHADLRGLVDFVRKW